MNLGAHYLGAELVEPFSLLEVQGHRASGWVGIPHGIYDIECGTSKQTEYNLPHPSKTPNKTTRVGLPNPKCNEYFALT